MFRYDPVLPFLIFGEKQWSQRFGFYAGLARRVEQIWADGAILFFIRILRVIKFATWPTRPPVADWMQRFVISPPGKKFFIATR